MAALCASASCGQPVALGEPHVAVVQQVETERAGVVTVAESDVVAYLHLGCSARDESQGGR